MAERYGLSEAQKRWLNDPNGFEYSNKPKLRKEILHKSLQTWSVMKYLLESNTPDDFKYQAFGEIQDNDWDRLDIPKDRFTFRHFIKALLKTSENNPASKETYRMFLAKTLIEESILYYQTRFKNNHFVHEKISEYKDFLSLLQGVYEQELNSLVKADFVRMRKGMIRPPTITQDKFYHSYCSQCYEMSKAVNATRKSQVLDIEHMKDCPFNEDYNNASDKTQVISDYIHIIYPKK